MKYTITKRTPKLTIKNAPYLLLTLVDEGGNEYVNVSLWSDNVAYQTALKENTIEGAVETVLRGNKTYSNFNSTTVSTSLTAKSPISAPGAVSTASPIQKAMNLKDVRITAALDRKEDSVKIASTARDATLIVTALMARNLPGELPFPTPAERDQEIAKEWKKWRQWLWTAWDSEGMNDIPFNG